MIISGADAGELERIRVAGRDHGGNEVEPFVDDGGGWPLRCCLRGSQVGERLAIIAFAPFPWESAYREVGPIVVHAEACAEPADEDRLASFGGERKILRAYGHDRRQRYERHRMVEAGDGLAAAIEDVLADPDVAFVHGRNVLSGCWAFAAERG